MPELANKKHELACQCYLKTVDKTKALIEAGYSKRTANQQVRKIFTRPEVSDRVDELLAERIERTQDDADRTLREIGWLAHVNLADIVKETPDGEFVLTKPFHELPRDVTAAIQSISRDQYGQLIVKFHDKLRALELKGRHEGLFKKDNEQKAKLTVISRDYRDAGDSDGDGSDVRSAV